MKPGKMMLSVFFLAGVIGITSAIGVLLPRLGDEGDFQISASAAELSLEDGAYLVDVTLSGGSGKASVESPAAVVIEDGQIIASITFGSPYYDYMLVDGERYEPVNTEGNSTFEIPVSTFDCEIAVTADTTAMSTPHEIDYTLYFDSTTIRAADEVETSGAEDAADAASEVEEASGAEDAADAASDPDNAAESAGADIETSDAGGDSVLMEGETDTGDTETADTGTADSETLNPSENTDIANEAIETEDTDADRNYPSGEDWCGLTWERSLELLYAEQFTVDYYEGGYTRIVIADEDVFLLLPEATSGDASAGNAEDATADTAEDAAADTSGDVSAGTAGNSSAASDTPDTEAVLENLPEDVVVLQQPIENIYLVATSAMDFFVSLDALDSIRLSGTNADGWYIEEAQAAMEAGDILYAGKYSAPDYELILSENCGLAIESTMIYHNPEVQEKLEAFGIPVLVERSSYESHPMGRTEWIKLYAVLFGLEDEAEELFDKQVAGVQAVETEESLGKTVAFFYITSAGTANVRKSNDYVAKMIELAGGAYVFEDLGEDDSATSTINMTMEEFYAGACDADYIIYNSTIDGELYTMDELLGKSALLADFTAVQNGNVWCTGKNLFQETTSLGDLIVEIHMILADEDVDDGELEFLHRIVEE